MAKRKALEPERFLARIATISGKGHRLSPAEKVYRKLDRHFSSKGIPVVVFKRKEGIAEPVVKKRGRKYYKVLMPGPGIEDESGVFSYTKDNIFHLKRKGKADTIFVKESVKELAEQVFNDFLGCKFRIKSHPALSEGGCMLGLKHKGRQIYLVSSYAKEGFHLSPQDKAKFEEFLADPDVREVPAQWHLDIAFGPVNKAHKGGKGRIFYSEKSVSDPSHFSYVGQEALDHVKKTAEEIGYDLVPVDDSGGLMLNFLEVPAGKGRSIIAAADVSPDFERKLRETFGERVKLVGNVMEPGKEALMPPGTLGGPRCLYILVPLGKLGKVKALEH